MELTLCLNSQGQGPARRRPRQDHQRQAPEGCPVIPPRHSRRPRRQTEDQRFISPEGSGRPRGEGCDQAGYLAQRLQGLQ